MRLLSKPYPKNIFYQKNFSIETAYSITEMLIPPSKEHIPLQKRVFWKIIFDLPSHWLSKKHAAPPEQTLTPPPKEKVRDVGMLHVTYFCPSIHITHMYVSEYVCLPQKKSYVTSGCAMSRICIYLCIYIYICILAN